MASRYSDLSGKIRREKITSRVHQFEQGAWHEMPDGSLECGLPAMATGRILHEARPCKKALLLFF